jgi:hypothetical protein
LWGSSSPPHLLFVSHSAGPTFLVSPSPSHLLSDSPSLCLLFCLPHLFSLSRLLFVSLFTDLTFSVSPSIWHSYCLPHLPCLTFSLYIVLQADISPSHLFLSRVPCITFLSPHSSVLSVSRSVRLFAAFLRPAPFWRYLHLSSHVYFVSALTFIIFLPLASNVCQELMDICCKNNVDPERNRTIYAHLALLKWPFLGKDCHFLDQKILNSALGGMCWN